jgi:hypothetical protein
LAPSRDRHLQLAREKLDGFIHQMDLHPVAVEPNLMDLTNRPRHYPDRARQRRFDEAAEGRLDADHRRFLSLNATNKTPRTTPRLQPWSRDDGTKAGSPSWRPLDAPRFLRRLVQIVPKTRCEAATSKPGERRRGGDRGKDGVRPRKTARCRFDGTYRRIANQRINRVAGANRIARESPAQTRAGC